MADNNTRIVISAVDQASGALGKVEKSLGSLGEQSQLLTGLMGRFTAALSVGALVGFTKGTIDAADSVNDLSQRLGIGVKQLAGWELASKQSGASLESIGKGVKGLSGYIAENGDKLRALGIDTTDANNTLIQLADGFAAMPDGMEKAALATKLFGKAGMDLIPMLNMGSKGLQEVFDKADAYGKKLAELAPEADKFNDQLEELAMYSKAAGINLMTPLVKGLNETTENFIRARDAGLGFFQALTGFGVRGINESIADAKKNSGERINELIKERDKVSAGLGKGEDFYVNQQLDEINAKLKYYRQLQLDTLPKANYSNEGGRTPGVDLSGLMDKPTKTSSSADKYKRPFDPEGDLEWKIEEERYRAQKKRADENAKATDDEIKNQAKLAEKYRDMADPLQKYREQLDEIRALRESGALKAETALEAEWQVQLKIDDQMAKTTESIKEQNKFANELGLTFSSAFEDAILGGKNFGDVLKGLEQDIARIILRKSITEPIGTGISDAIKGSGIGASIGGWFKDVFKFEDGGIMGAGGPLPLRAYAGGGIANSPQLALYGEGSMNEAFVPLPDGRRIPVAMQGGSAPAVTINQTINIDSRSDQATIVAAMMHAKEAAKSEIMQSMRRGGAFA